MQPHSPFLKPYSPGRRLIRRRAGGVYKYVFAGLIVLVALVGVGVKVWLGGSGTDLSGAMVHKVERGAFAYYVDAQGEVDSGNSVEIRCEVKARNGAGTSIIEVEPEGKMVEANAVLAKLDSSGFELEKIQQQALIATKQAAVIQADNQHEAYKLAKKEYLEGIFLQTRQTIQSEIFVADETLRRAEQYLSYSGRLAAKGYVTSLQLEGDRFAVEKARKDLEVATQKLRVLETYTKDKELRTLDANIQIAAAQLTSESKNLSLEEEKLKDIEDQIAKCVIRAPVAGQVVYANERSARQGSEFIVMPGAQVRERQVLFRMPISGKAQIITRISESRVGLLKEHQKAAITIDALDGMTLDGIVERINPYPEPTNFFNKYVKEYGVLIRIVNPPAGVRPGLTAKIRVDVDYRDGVLQVPVESVTQHGTDFYCAVQVGDGFREQKVEIGPNNDKFVVITGGLKESDLVALNPREYLNLPSPAGSMDVVRLPQKIETRILLAENEKKPGEGRRGNSSPAQMMQRYDKNTDGKLSQDELPEQMQPLFSSLDTNKDGSIDLTEAAGMARLRRPGGTGGNSPGEGPGGGERPPRDAGGGE